MGSYSLNQLIKACPQAAPNVRGLPRPSFPSSLPSPLSTGRPAPRMALNSPQGPALPDLPPSELRWQQEEGIHSSSPVGESHSLKM